MTAAVFSHCSKLCSSLTFIYFHSCEETQSVEYPAFSGSAYLALDAPDGGRFFKLSMKIKPTYPVQDGIIMYCAESKRGLGGFTSLAVRNQRLEFRYDLNDGKYKSEF